MRDLFGQFDWSRMAGTVLVASVGITFYALVVGAIVWLVVKIAEALL